MKTKNTIKSYFTLIEVAVVLLVLVALAGLIVPLAIGYADRAHGSTGAGNLAQLTSNLNRFEIENFSMPNGWDNLVDENDDLYDTAGGKLGTAVLSTISSAGVGKDAADSLNAAGITIVHKLIDADTVTAGTQYTTFGGTGAAVTFTDALEVATISGANVASLLGASNSTTDSYVAFGIGEKITAIGKTLATAPYDFPEGGQKPEDSYRRFIAVFNVSGKKAKFVGVVANTGSTLINIQDYISKYFNAN